MNPIDSAFGTEIRTARRAGRPTRIAPLAWQRALATVCLAAFATGISAGGALGQTSVSLRYEPILEWSGPHFLPFHSPGILVETDSPPVEISFQQPRAIAAISHAGRDVIYVADSGNNRIQAFEVNATFSALSQGNLSFSGGAPAAGEFSDQILRVPEYQPVPTQWIVPGSEAIYVNGVVWRRVEDIAGFNATDQVYSIDYDALVDQPEFEFPVGSLSALTTFEIRYLLSDLQDFGGGTPSFGVGDVDYGLRDGGTTPVKVQIDETSGGPDSWQEIRALALTSDLTTPTTDHIFVADAGDDSGTGDEQIFSYFVDLSGAITAGERYGDALSGPYGLSILDLDPGAGASAWIDANSGPFDKTAYPFVIDANQISGHDYEVTVATGAVTITDLTTGRVLLDQAAEADFADPFLGIPGLSLPLNGGPWGDGTTTVSTKAASPGRFLVVSDTGNDRIKIIGLPSDVTSAGSNWSGDWLPKDPRSVVAQPSGAGTVGASDSEEYRPTTPASVPEDWTSWTAAAPIAEESLSSLVFDPDGTPETWIRVDDITTAGPEDGAFEVDWQTGRIRFGDGIHGRIPPASTDFEYQYEVTPDLVRYGTSGTGAGRFASPRGIGGLWNTAVGRFDIYVADSGNHRVQKLAFSPADTSLGTGARVAPVVEWGRGSVGSPPLAYPQDMTVAADGTGMVYLALSDPQNERIVVYRDIDFDLPEPGPAVFDASIGQLGNRLGNFVSPSGVAFLPNGTDLDLYVADESRDVVTKYEEGPTPGITLLFTGDSALPNCFPPSGGYPIRFTTTHPPLGGWVDFYYDTKSTFDPATAKLALAAGTVAPTATYAYWDFDATPSGAPPAGDFYLFARLKDPTGTEVAWDQTLDPMLFCIDPSLVPGLVLSDAIDGDRTLYLQNGLLRDVRLEVVYPESLAAVAYRVSYDPTLVRVRSITPGTAWDGIGYTDHVFNASIDSVAGVFEVNSSVLGAPTGLSGAGPFHVATVQVQARFNAISATARFKDADLTLDRSLSSMVDVLGNEPTLWSARSCDVRIAYLGDIATTGAGADSVVPHLQPRPDGRIDFDDQMAFTLGWNGVQFVRDRIADMGPAVASSPNLWPVPDAEWDVDDIVVFTSQFSYFASAGWNTGTSARPIDIVSLEGGQARSAAPSPEISPGGSISDGGGSASASSAWGTGAVSAGGKLSAEVLRTANGSEIRVWAREVTDLAGARLGLRFDPGLDPFVEGMSDDLLRDGGGQVLHLTREETGYWELGLSRLAPGRSGVSGAGPLAVVRMAYAPFGGAVAVELEYDLRNDQNHTIEQGSLGLTILGDGDGIGRDDVPTLAFLSLPRPNPTTGSATIEFGLPEPREVQLLLYAVDGRRLRALAEGEYPAGTYRLVWDGKSEGGHELAAGRYYLELRAGPFVARKSLLLLR